MTSLHYFNPISTIRLSNKPDVKSWSKIYKLINPNSSLIDRAETFKQPVTASLYSGCQLPPIQVQNLSYKDCCDIRVKELWNTSSRLGKPLGLMWSGGIDSTRMLVAFLENFSMAELKDRIKIITSEEAVIENSEFYWKYILPNFELVNAEHLPWLYDKSMILIDGEMNDQLFGPGMIRVYMLEHPDAFTRPLSRDILCKYVNKRLDDEHVSELLVDAILTSSESYGIKLEKDIDWFWWWNFCFKWQSTWFIKLTLCTPKLRVNLTEQYIKDYTPHFFDSIQFQLWSINNPQVRILKKWTDHKYQAKLEIYDFDKNKNYLETKVKRGSLKTIFNQRLLFEGIDSKFNIIEKIDPDLWYNTNNIFK